MMDKFSLVYIDDAPDTALTKYLDKDFHSDKFEVTFSEIIFNPKNGYQSLLNDAKVQSANIIFIDSRLFEARTATQKFTGEEFELVLKKFYPFIEVIVITQNETGSPVEKLAKYDGTRGDSAAEYYAEIIPPIIEKAVKNIQQYQFLSQLVEKNDSWEPVLKSRVIATLKGIDTYDQLTKSDIDELVSAFKEIQEIL